MKSVASLSSNLTSSSPSSRDTSSMSYQFPPNAAALLLLSSPSSFIDGRSAAHVSWLAWLQGMIRDQNMMQTAQMPVNYIATTSSSSHETERKIRTREMAKTPDNYIAKMPPLHEMEIKRTGDNADGGYPYPSTDVLFFRLANNFGGGVRPLQCFYPFTSCSTSKSKSAQGYFRSVSEASTGEVKTGSWSSSMRQCLDRMYSLWLDVIFIKLYYD